MSRRHLTEYGWLYLAKLSALITNVLLYRLASDKLGVDGFAETGGRSKLVEVSTDGDDREGWCRLTELGDVGARYFVQAEPQSVGHHGQVP